jgi:hypothetical protein
MRHACRRESGYELQHAPAGGTGVVSAEAFEFSAEAGKAQDIQQVLHGGGFQALPPDREVVSFANEGDEAETEQARGGGGSDTAVRACAGTRRGG